MSDDLVKRWDEYVESMGCVMGEVEHMAQQMRDRIEELEAKLAKAMTALHEIADTPARRHQRKIAKSTIAELTGGKDE